MLGPVFFLGSNTHPKSLTTTILTLILFFHLRSLPSCFANGAFCKEGMTTSVFTALKGYDVRATNCLNKL